MGGRTVLEWVGLLVAATGVLGMILVAVIATGLLAPLDSPGDWLGEAGVVGTITGLLTVAGAAAAVYGVYLNNKRSLEAIELGRIAELAGRFQKGVELLESSNLATRMGGMLVLRDAVLAAPDAYYLSVFRILSSYIEQQTRDDWEGYFPKGGVPRDYRFPTLPATTDDVVLAFQVISEIRRDDKRRALEVGQSLSIRRFTLGDVTLSGLCLDGLELAFFAGGNVGFRDCSFRGATLQIMSAEMFRFDQCDFTSGNNHFTSFEGAFVSALECDFTDCRQFADDIHPTSCDLTATRFQATISPNVCWYRERPPMKNAISYAHEEIEEIGGRVAARTTSLGMPIYR